MESVSNKKRKRSLEQKLNSERNDYYKKLRKEQKKKRIKRRNGSEKQLEAPAIKRNTERQTERNTFLERQFFTQMTGEKLSLQKRP